MNTTTPLVLGHWKANRGVQSSHQIYSTELRPKLFIHTMKSTQFQNQNGIYSFTFHRTRLAPNPPLRWASNILIRYLGSVQQYKISNTFLVFIF